ncbi:methionine-tRNA ligase [Verruconis gallopava]|uniref:methionine--tRNA ligase n=1 Tax=Verruconis gallopava TaxID=253628 RepID=A0A0D1YK81_9PEZI|nr:methionine-tRNA ligase [Verruconis gallopava]KIW01282.1 methionine-tRNA ligase [Verruconis gallopava]
MASGIILPQEGKRNILITSALPFVNNVPHLGNIIGSVLSADVFARYSRARGINTLYICGTDEYGTSTETKALLEKITPQELCDKYHAVHAGVYAWFNISFDKFGRTTTQQQTEVTQAMFLKLKENGFLKELTTTQLYCLEHQSFLADRFVEGTCPHCKYPDAQGDQCDLCGRLLDPLDLIEPRCKMDGAKPVERETTHMFFELDKLQGEIEAFFQERIAESPWSVNATAITAAWLKQGLQARSVTRDYKWGTKVPLPGYEDKVIYSWFDAPIGYISITATYTDQWEKWWRNPDVQLYQFMGKDNVIFHSIQFPASQIGTRENWTKLHHLSACEYLTYEGGKFSKSRGIGVFGDSAQKSGVPSDVWRYYLLSHRPESGDTDFDWDSFITANNSTLLNNLGNFVSRVIKFVAAKHYNSVVPAAANHEELSFKEFKDEVNALLAQYVKELDAVKLRAGLATALQISQLGNGFLQSNNLSNRLVEEEPEKCNTVVNLAINLIHLLASVFEPYMPDTAASINRQLNTSPQSIPDQWKVDSIQGGHKIGTPEYLFQRIAPAKAEEWRKMFGNQKEEKAKEGEMSKKAAKKAAKKKAKEAAVADGAVEEPTEATQK